MTFYMLYDKTVFDGFQVNNFLGNSSNH